jgi:hypothetical protein
MSEHHCSGGCYCGNIGLEVDLTIDPATINPRACDCNFCRAHGAAYVTDPNGSVAITIKDPSLVTHYQMGDRMAEFLLCKRCGVLVGGGFEHDGRRYATVNVNALDARCDFAEPVVVSPQKLSGEQKAKRWQELWFADVTLTETGA